MTWDFSWNLRNVRFHKGAKLEKWGVLVIRDGGRDDFAGERDPELDTIITGFSNMCRTSGMQVDGTPPVRLVAELPDKRREDSDPIRSNAIKAVSDALMSMPARKMSKPKLLMVNSPLMASSVS
jgi:eukaryotic translation initiation factor 2C